MSLGYGSRLILHFTQNPNYGTDSEFLPRNEKIQRPDTGLELGSGEAAPSYKSCRSQLYPATFLAVSRVIEKIKSLLMSRTHLIEGSEFPRSYVEFLDHCNSWSINHRRWQEQKVEYSWHSRINWPSRFEKQVLKTFKVLKSRHAQLIGQLTPRREPNLALQRTWPAAASSGQSTAILGGPVR